MTRGGKRGFLVKLEQYIRVREHLGKISAAIIVLFFASLLDSCVARFRAPLFTVHLLPGTSEQVDGQLDNDIKNLSELHIENPGAGVQLKIDRLQSGFWFGGNMWVGSIGAASDATTGTFDLRVFRRDQPFKTPVAAFRAIVYPDYKALQRSFFSIIQRSFNVEPGMVAMGCIPALGLVLGLIYLFGRKEESLLADQGRAEIFLMKPAVDGIDLYFAMGKRHGLTTGMRVSICASDGQFISDAEVRAVYDRNAMAFTKAPAHRLPRTALIVLPEFDKNNSK